ncbi:universal stress protein [Catenulispora subtropica]
MTPTVVVGYDESPASELALEEAAEEAERRSAALAVVHAYRSLPPVPPPFEPVAGHPMRDAAMRTTEQAADRIRGDHPGLTVQTRAVPGLAGIALAEASTDADLLVVGHRGHGGFPGLGLGSVALRAAAHSSVPTLVVRGGRRRPRGMVLAAVDIEDAAAGSDEILGFAFAEAAQRGAELKAISAWEILWPRAYFGDTGQLRRAADLARERADAGLAGLVRPWRDKYPDVVTEHKLADGEPSTVLVHATTYADLVVVGARRREDRGARLGPIVHTLLRHADCPVAVVPHS